MSQDVRRQLEAELIGQSSDDPLDAPNRQLIVRLPIGNEDIIRIAFSFVQIFAQAYLCVCIQIYGIVLFPFTYDLDGVFFLVHVAEFHVDQLRNTASGLIQDIHYGYVSL